MATAIGAHLTAVYPVEHTGPEALAERVRAVAATMPPLHLTLAGYGLFPRPDDGAYREVLDDTGAFAALRRALTAPPFRMEPVDPHVTIVHPRTSKQTAAFWAARPRAPEREPVVIEALHVTGFDGERWVSVLAAPLAGLC